MAECGGSSGEGAGADAGGEIDIGGGDGKAVLLDPSEKEVSLIPSGDRLTVLTTSSNSRFCLDLLDNFADEYSGMFQLQGV